MPFGMINSGATFVRMMDKVLEGFDEFADLFIDDIGIFSDTWEFHVEHLRAVFQSLREAKLVAKPSKCFVGYGELEFLGNESANSSNPSKTLSIIRTKVAPELIL
jgi:hypothetical protein